MASDMVGYGDIVNCYGDSYRHSVDTYGPVGTFADLGLKEKRLKRRYSSHDLRIFKYSFDISGFETNLVNHLSQVGILKKKVKRRGSRAGTRRTTYNGVRSIEKIISVSGPTGGRCYRTTPRRKLNKENLIIVNAPFILYKYPGILFSNCRSIRNKFDELQAYMHYKNPDVAVFVETWLEDKDTNSFDLNGYAAFHRIRNRPDKAHGGGTSIYFKKDISIVSVVYPEMKEVEAITVMYRVNYMQREIPWMAIIAVYYPPASQYADEYIEYILAETDRLKAINANANIMIIGDFNDLKIDCRLKKPFFIQLIDKRTCNEKIIDKCFYNGSLSYDIVISAPISTSDHKSVELLPIGYVHNKDNTIRYQTRPKRNSCYRKMGQILTDTQWEELIGFDDCDRAVEAFHSFIVSTYNDCFPVIEIKKKKNSKTWFNNQIAATIKKRDQLFMDNNIQYKQMTKTVKELIKQAKYKEYNKMISLIDNRTLDFYKLVNKYSSQNKQICQHIAFPGLSESESIDNVISYYENIMNQHPPLASGELPAFLPCLPSDLVTEAFVFSQLKKVRASMSTAPDGIPNFVLQEYAVELAYPVTRLINKSLQEGHCPVLWKMTFLVTLPKKNVVESPSDLRPIVISSSLVKILEKHIVNNILSDIGDKIDKRQFGGLPGRSADHYITFYLDYVAKTLDSLGNRVTAIVTDYSKAFDSVDHTLLVEKLIELNVQPSLIKWIISFLANRSIVLKSSNNQSKRVINCSNGAPQGSVLGGLIFTIIVNEIASAFSSRLKYVDDLTVLCSQSVIDEDCLPQRIMESLCKDSINAKMSLNIQKCQYMTHCFSRRISPIDVKIGNESLKMVEQCKIIGVIIQSNLKWDAHIQSIITKTNKKFYLLYRLRNVGMKIDLLARVYCLYIRPCLEYCCVVWTNSITKSQVHSLESIQKRAIKIIMGSHFSSYRESLRVLGIDTMENRRKILFGKYATRFMSTYPEMLPDSGFVSSGRVTRSSCKISVPRHRTNRYRFSPIPMMIEAINSVI